MRVREEGPRNERTILRGQGDRGRMRNHLSLCRFRRVSRLLTITLGLLGSTAAYAQDERAQVTTKGEVLLESPVKGTSVLPATSPTLPTAPSTPHDGPAIAWKMPSGGRVQAKTYWYGWQTALIVGGADLVGIFALTDVESLSNVNPGLLTASIVTHFAAGPIIHWAHGHVGRGFATIGLNVVLPCAGLALGSFTEANEKNPSVPVGLLLGFVGATVLDAAFLGYETVVPKVASQKQVWPVRFGVLPRFGAHDKGFSIVGQF